MVTFCERLKTALEMNNMTKAELARKTGINDGTISRYINGEIEAKQTNILLLSQALGVKPSWLMGFDDPNNDDMLRATVVSMISSLSEENLKKIAEYLQFLRTQENRKD